MKKLLAFAVASLLALAAFPALAQTGVVWSQTSVSNKNQTFVATGSETLAATPTDVFILTGSASKTVYVKSIEISCTKTAAGAAQVLLIRRSTANTGASTSVTPVKLDTGNVAAVAAVAYYSVNPSPLGTAVGTVSRRFMQFHIPTSVTDVQPSKFLWGDTTDQYLVLRGATDILAINMAGATLSGAICAYTATWMER